MFNTSNKKDTEMKGVGDSTTGFDDRTNEYIQQNRRQLQETAHAMEQELLHVQSEYAALTLNYSTHQVAIDYLENFIRENLNLEKVDPTMQMLKTDFENKNIQINEKIQKIDKTKSALAAIKSKISPTLSKNSESVSHSDSLIKRLTAIKSAVISTISREMRVVLISLNATYLCYETDGRNAQRRINVLKPKLYDLAKLQALTELAHDHDDIVNLRKSINENRIKLPMETNQIITDWNENKSYQSIDKKNQYTAKEVLASQRGSLSAGIFAGKTKSVEFIEKIDREYGSLKLL